jgi:hypothetical protein
MEYRADKAMQLAGNLSQTEFSYQAIYGAERKSAHLFLSENHRDDATIDILAAAASSTPKHPEAKPQTSKIAFESCSGRAVASRDRSETVKSIHGINRREVLGHCTIYSSIDSSMAELKLRLESKCSRAKTFVGLDHLLLSPGTPLP